MKKTAYILITVFMLAACNTGKPEETSRPLLDRPQFVEVMVDVQLLEGSYSARFQKVDSLRKNMTGFYQQVFEKHKITREEFEQTYRWYSNHPDDMSAVYSAVFDELARREVEMSPLKKDSLRTGSETKGVD